MGGFSKRRYVGRLARGRLDAVDLLHGRRPVPDRLLFNYIRAIPPCFLMENRKSQGEPSGLGDLVAGIIHVFAAFDWGDELPLERPRTLTPSVPSPLPR